MRARSLALALVVALGGCTPTLVATAPADVPAPLPPLPASRIDTQLRIPLSAIESAAEASVPRTFRREPYSLVLDGTDEAPVVTAGYQFDREGFDLEIEGGRLVLRTTLAYWLRARRRVGFVDVPGSCGVDEPRRRIALAIAVTARVADDFGLEAQLQLTELTPLDRCEMTFAGVDVTARVRTAIAEELGRELPALRTRIREGVDLRGKVLSAFARMAAPVALDDGGQLVLAPDAAGVSGPVLEPHHVRFGLALRMAPRIVLGGETIAPSPVTTPTRIEPADTPAIALHIPVRVTPEHMRAMLAEEFELDTGGLRFPPTGRRYVRPTDVTLSAFGSSLVVRVTFTGYADGVFYLRGRPSLDPATAVLRADDLDFTVESSSVLVRLASVLRADDLRDELRRRVVLGLREPLERARLSLTDSLRREIDGVALEGAIDAMDLVDARTDPADGSLVLVLLARGRVTAQYVGE